MVPEPIRRSAASAWQAGRRYGTDGDLGFLNSSSAPQCFSFFVALASLSLRVIVIVVRLWLSRG